jgi:hypothetical protein
VNDKFIFKVKGSRFIGSRFRVGDLTCGFGDVYSIITLIQTGLWGDWGSDRGNHI